MLLEGKMLGVGPKLSWTKGKKEKRGQIHKNHQKRRSEIRRDHSDVTSKPTCVIAPRENTQRQLPGDTMTNACATWKIKSRLHPAIKARQTQFPTSHRTAFQCERLGSLLSRKHAPLFPASSRWALVYIYTGMARAPRRENQYYISPLSKIPTKSSWSLQVAP